MNPRPTKPVCVGLVGAGPWAANVHAPGLAAHPDIRLAGVWARRPDAAAALAGEYASEAVSSYPELLASVDAVAFAVPPAVQAALAVEAATAGRHLILDKPIAGTLEEADRLVAAVEHAGVASLVLLTLRYAPETRAWLGDLHATGGWSGASARWLSGALLGGDYALSPWRHEHGALADVGPHAFDLLDASLGEITGVIATARSEPDLWTVVLAHAGGAVSSVVLGLKVPTTPSVVGVEVFGRAGHRHFEPGQTTPQQCYATLLDEFIALVRDGAVEHPCDVRRGRHLQRVIADAYRCAS